MEALVLVAVLTVSTGLAVAAALGTLMLAMYLIDASTGWTAATPPTRLAGATAWRADAVRPDRPPTEHPIAA